MTAEQDPAEIVTRHRPGRKDTRSWCKGKVGRAHTEEISYHIMLDQFRLASCVEYMVRASGKTKTCLHQKFCSSCGKVLEQLISWDYCPDNPAALTR